MAFRIGIIGGGGIARAHGRAAQQVEAADLVAVCDVSAEAAAAFDAQLRKVLTEQFPGDYLIAPHRVWASVARSPG